MTLAVSAAKRSAITAAIEAANDKQAPPVRDAISWQELTQLHDYDRALAALERAGNPDNAETRLARGWLALRAGHHAEAVQALQGLESELGIVSDEVKRWFIEAAAHAGPYAEAAEVLSNSAKVSDLLLAARAQLSAGDAKAARKTVDRALRRARKTRRRVDERQAHALRAEIAQKAGDNATAVGDLRWLLRNAVKTPLARAALTQIADLGGAVDLDTRLEVLARTTTKANLSATFAEFERLAQRHANKAALITFARAKAAYAARDNTTALAAFDQAATPHSVRSGEALYYAARSATRLGKEKEAIERYQDVASRFRKERWAERASYRHAELLMQTGQYDEAAQAFARYASRFGRTRHTETARYSRAVSLLSGGKAKPARELFSALRRKANSRRFKASLQQLEALAALRAGDKKTAVRLWRELVREQPLTWPALVAHARLQQIGEATVPLMPPPLGIPAASPALTVQLPPPAALLHSLGLDTAAESALIGLESTVSKRYPGRESEALCQLYRPLAVAHRRAQLGSRAASIDLLMRAPSASERWAWECVYPRPFESAVATAERLNGLPAGLVHAVMRQESRFRTTAVSPAGAHGLMQLMPNTAKRVAAELPLPAGDVDAAADLSVRPKVNIELGSFYLGKLLKNFNGSLPLAVAAYNAGPHAAKHWLESSLNRDVDLWVARIPYRETRHYVARVLTNFARYQWLAGGTDAVTPLDLVLPKSADIGRDAY